MINFFFCSRPFKRDGNGISILEFSGRGVIKEKRKKILMLEIIIFWKFKFFGVDEERDCIKFHGNIAMKFTGVKKNEESN